MAESKTLWVLLQSDTATLMIHDTPLQVFLSPAWRSTTCCCWAFTNRKSRMTRQRNWVCLAPRQCLRVSWRSRRSSLCTLTSWGGFFQLVMAHLNIGRMTPKMATLTQTWRFQTFSKHGFAMKAWGLRRDQPPTSGWRLDSFLMFRPRNGKVIETAHFPCCRQLMLTN